jgi:hypothetical protein
MRRLRDRLTPAHLVLALVLLAGLVLRVRNNDYGLPYVYNVDEGSHFTSRAVAMLDGDLDPGYFQNPSGFTYIVHLALRLRYGHGWPFGDYEGAIEQFRYDPTPIYELARSLAAVVCLAGVVGVFWAARRLWGTREGLVAAALLCFGFLPVVYSRIAVTDVGTLLPVAVCVWAAVRVREEGALRHFALAGAAAGLAVGFKYTAGLVVLALLVAAAPRLRADWRRTLGGLALAGGAAVLAFFVTTPYFLLDLDTSLRQIEAQADTAGDFPKLGQREDSGLIYYLDSLTWGLGWIAALAALAGLALEARRDLVRALALAAFPLALLAYLSVQSRYFGRWLLPAYPVLCMLAAVALVRLAAAGERALARRRSLAPGRSAAIGAGLVALATLAALAQPLAADVRTMRLLGRTDTRELAREWLRTHERPSLRIVIEPAVPARYYRRGRPGQRTAVLTRKQFVRGFARDIQETRLDYAATLRPERIDRYREAGFCLVMTMSVIRGRAENDEVAPALAYYRRLERESRLVYRATPWKAGADPPRFHFDRSYNYYPTAYERPGPEVRIHRLDDCEQGYGPVPAGTGRPETADERARREAETRKGGR